MSRWIGPSDRWGSALTGYLTADQRDLLRSPLNLVLLRTIADQPDALSFASSRQLFDAYWDRKRRDCQQRRPTRFAKVIGVLADAMSVRQRLSVPLRFSMPMTCSTMPTS